MTRHEAAPQVGDWDPTRDLYVLRPTVDGHAMRPVGADNGRMVITCECGWQSGPTHVSSLIGAQNRHTIEVAS